MTANAFEGWGEGEGLKVRRPEKIVRMQKPLEVCNTHGRYIMIETIENDGGA